jgi:AAA+ ATPase superfamily predicted ATPase
VRNPFTLVVAQGDEFCDRKKELADLVRIGENRQNVVFYSPRRYGKTSLITKAFGILWGKGFVTIYIDLFHISSEHDFVEQLSSGILNALGRGVGDRSYAQKLKDIFGRIIMGIEVTPDGYEFKLRLDKEIKVDAAIDDIMDGMRKYVEEKKLQVCIALDEFQTVTELKEGKKIEAKLRSHIQFSRDITYFFIGSRRHLLVDMFKNKIRPFYKIADDYELREIAKDDFSSYIVEMFKKSGKECPKDIAERTYEIARGYPYYVQKLAQLLWDLTDLTCDNEDLASAHRVLVKSESKEFAQIWESLSLVQKNIIKAIAKNPEASLYTREFLEQHSLSVGGSQKAIRALDIQDLIEKHQGHYRLTDPIMAEWLRQGAD